MDKVKQILDITGTGVCIESRLIEDYDQLIGIIDSLKNSGKRIVYTSGTYDLIHVGHARYFQKAKEYGDILLVGIDSDELAREKGSNRPIVPYEERSEMLMHNRSVDIVTPLFKKDRDQLFERIRPDVLILSTSTKDEAFLNKMKEKLGPFCGTIEILDPQATTSTTARVRLITIGGAKDLSKKIEDVIKTHLGEETSTS